MWEKIKMCWSDRRYRLPLIAAILIAAIIFIVLSFALDAAAYSVSGIDYTVVYQDGYQGATYPTDTSNGFSASTGDFVIFYNVDVVDSNGDSILSSPYYYYFSFDLSNLDFSYEYDLVVYGLANTKISFDGMLTTAYTLSSSDSSVTATRTRYNSIVFSPDSVTWDSTSSSTDTFRYTTFTLNDYVDSDGNLSITFSYSSSPGIRFAFLIDLAGTDFQQLLYRSGTISSSTEYYQLLDDISSAAATGSISADEASMIADNAANTQSQVQTTNVTDAYSSFTSIVSDFTSAASGLSGSDLLDAYNDYFDRLTSSLSAYMNVISSVDEASALQDVYNMAYDQLKDVYQTEASNNLFDQLDSTNSDYSTYEDYESSILDNISGLNLSNSLNITSWISNLSSSEISDLSVLWEAFMSNYEWSIFIQISIYLTIVITLLGTARLSRSRDSKKGD